MKLLLKRIAVYSLCFFVSYFPVQRANAALPLFAGVALDIVAGVAVSVATDKIVSKSICGKKPWAANDPVFACNASSTKSNWLKHAKSSAKWAIVFTALGYVATEVGVLNTEKVSTNFIQCRNNKGSGSYGVAYSLEGCFALQQSAAQASGSEYLEYDNGWHVWVSVDKKNPSHHGVLFINDGDLQRAGVKISDEQFANEFWASPPDFGPDVWFPEPDVSDIPSVHPDPKWFPDIEPLTQPFAPPKPLTNPYPKELPDSHPNKRPVDTPKPEYDDWPGELPGAWPEGWPLPGALPGTPGGFPQEWPLPGTEVLPGDKPNRIPTEPKS
ncbi:hypothetical protein [Vibrio taketomensis]|uniref:hypothetical protein n=1 Tax=Vibrio taketomensis TaxID=2572923 RepID=UPI00138941FC|nr:hypothetical protein [Vibrio taketomensis]